MWRPGHADRGARFPPTRILSVAPSSVPITSFAQVGVPAISFRPGLNLVNGGVAAGTAAAAEYTEKLYHQPADEWSPDWDLSGCAMDVELLYTIGRDMANSRTWPQWEAGSEFKAA